MPIGISFITQMPALPFSNAEDISRQINAYFDHTNGKFHMEAKPAKTPNDVPGPEQKIWDREPEPATFAGLAFFLGFNSLREFEDYEDNGEFAPVLKRGRLRIEAAYEKKLHYQSPTGAIFALKNMGWNDKAEDEKDSAPAFKTLKIEICEAGPRLADNEKSVIL